MGEEGSFDLGAELVAGGRAEVYVTEKARGARPLAVVPGAEDDEDFVVCVMWLEGEVFGLRTPHVFLVPPAADFERGHGDLGEVGFDGANLPVVVVGGVVDESLPGGEDADAGFLDVAGERAGVEEEVVGITVDLAESVFLAGFEADGVIVSIALTPGSVVEEVVADPEVGHGGLRRNGFYGGVAVDGGFDGEEAGIGDAHDADAAGVV